MILENKSENQKLKTNIAIIGGGLSGLAAAFRLLELKKTGDFNGDFLLLEAGNRLGGLIESIRRDEFLLETGADAFLSEKPEAVNLAKRLGVENQLISTNDVNRRSFIVRRKKLRPVPEGFRLIAPTNLEAFFASEILSRRGKIRLANERFLPASPEKDDESLADFVRRRFGNEALQRIAQPMFAGIYTADPEKLSIRATQPQFVALEQKYGSVINGLAENAKSSVSQNSKSETDAGVRYSLFLSFREGMQTLLDVLASKLPKDCFHLLALTQTLKFDENQRLWQIKLKNGNEITADAVCLALPAFEIARLLEDGFSALSDELTQIEFASTATINLAFRRDRILHELNGFGFVVPFIEKRNLMACTFSSVKFAARAPENYVLLRAFVGGALQPEKFDLEDEAMIAGVLQDLRELIGLVGEPIFSHVARWARSMPQYAVGHLARVERIKKMLAEISSISLATTAMDGVGIPDSIRHGETAAQNLAEFVKTKRS